MGSTVSIVDANKVIASLLDMNVTPYPECYEVWYRHEQGDHPTLSDHIDALLASQDSITADYLCDLHTRYCKPLLLAELSQQHCKQIVNSATDLTEITDALINSSEELNSDAKKTIEDLKTPDISTQEANNFIRSLTHSIELSLVRNHDLENKLSTALDEIQSLKSNLEKHKNDANIDALTSLHNRRHFDTKFEPAFINSTKANRPLSLIVTDIDHFKRFNDNWGHSTGDAALKLVASILKKNTKGKDIVARYGGEEFVILLFDATIEKATKLANELRLAVSSRNLVRKSTQQSIGTITMSFGVAETGPYNSAQQFFEAADRALYKAKRKGRNCVVAAQRRRREDTSNGSNSKPRAIHSL